MVGWHHRLNGHEFEQTPGDSGGQGSLACKKKKKTHKKHGLCKVHVAELDLTEQLNNSTVFWILFLTMMSTLFLLRDSYPQKYIYGHLN